MIVIGDEPAELSTPYGPMRTHIVRPAAPGKYPGIVFFTEIFQVAGPIRRTAAMLAGRGYIVGSRKFITSLKLPGRCWRMTRRVPIAAMRGRPPKSSRASTRTHLLCSTI